MSAHVVRSSSVDELRDARRLAHRLILKKPDAPGALLFKAFCRDVGAELARRGELAPDCPFCLADLAAAAGKPAVIGSGSTDQGVTSAPLVGASR